MLTELFEKYGNQKPMDLGTAVERTIPVSAVVKMMEEYHEGKVKNLDILHVSNSVSLEGRELLLAFIRWIKSNDRYLIDGDTSIIDDFLSHP